MTTPTKLPASALWPGPDMDALVAEHVLGWIEIVKRDDSLLYPYFGTQPEPHRAGPMPIPGYSTSDAAALEVLKAMVDQCHQVVLSHTRVIPGHWQVMMSNPSNNQNIEEAFAGTFAEAICLAALKCKGIIE